MVRFRETCVGNAFGRSLQLVPRLSQADVMGPPIDMSIGNASVVAGCGWGVSGTLSGVQSGPARAQVMEAYGGSTAIPIPGAKCRRFMRVVHSNRVNHDRQPRSFQGRGEAGYWLCCAGFRPLCLVLGFPAGGGPARCARAGHRLRPHRCGLLSGSQGPGGWSGGCEQGAQPLPAGQEGVFPCSAAWSPRWSCTRSTSVSGWVCTGALADAGPVTSVELAGRTGTVERYVRGWLE
jgi:hypothetical protein